jgi:hypothetical protein
VCYVSPRGWGRHSWDKGLGRTRGCWVWHHISRNVPHLWDLPHPKALLNSFVSYILVFHYVEKSPGHWCHNVASWWCRKNHNLQHTPQPVRVIIIGWKLFITLSLFIILVTIMWSLYNVIVTTMLYEGEGSINRPNLIFNPSSTWWPWKDLKFERVC